MKLSFVVQGEPVSKARPRVTSHGTYTPKKTLRYERAVLDCAVAQLYRDRMDINWPADGDFAVECKFYLGTFRPVDTDNLAKAVLDGLQGAVIANDNQVSKLTALRVYGDANPRTEVTVEFLGAKPVRAKRSRKAKQAV